MDRIKQISTILKWSFGAYLIILPLSLLTIWILSGSTFFNGAFLDFLTSSQAFDITTRSLGKAYGISDISTLSWSARLLGVFGSLCQDSFKWIAALYTLCLMNLYANGNLFSQKHGHYFKRIGQFLLLYGTVGYLLGDALLSVAITFDSPPGQHLLSLSFGTPNITMLVISGLITLIGWVTQEAFKMRQEQELTI